MSIDDATLVAALQSDDPQQIKEAWAEWYNRDAAVVRRALGHRATWRVDVEALTHDAFIAAVMRIRSGQFCYRRGRLRWYVYAVALNLLRDEQRLRRYTEVPLSASTVHARSSTAEILFAPATTDPAAVFEARSFELWLAEQVHVGLAVLEPEQRQLLDAHYLKGRTCRELATERQIPASTLQARLWRLRARLRRQPALRRAWEMLAA